MKFSFSILALLFASAASSMPTTTTTTTSNLMASDWRSHLTITESVKLESLAKDFGDFEALMFVKYNVHYCSQLDTKCNRNCAYLYGMDDTEGLLGGDCMVGPDRKKYFDKKGQFQLYEAELAEKYA